MSAPKWTAFLRRFLAPFSRSETRLFYRAYQDHVASMAGCAFVAVAEPEVGAPIDPVIVANLTRRTKEVET